MNKLPLFILIPVCMGLIVSCAEPKQIGEQIVDAESAAESGQDKQLIPVEEAVVSTPGSVISFSHDYDGESDPNIREAFLLKVRKPSWGEMELMLSTSSGLSLLTESEMSFNDSETLLDVPIEFLAENAGSYRINVVASVTSEDTPMRAVQAYSITVDVGSIGIVSESPKILIRDADGEPVVIRSAKEIIE